MAESEQSSSPPGASSEGDEYAWEPLSTILDIESTVPIATYEFLDLVGDGCKLGQKRLLSSYHLPNDGAYGEVWRAKTSSSSVCAVKQLQRKTAGSATALAPQIRREISILRSVQHRNVVSLRDVGIDDPEEPLEGQNVYLIMDFVPFSLASLINEANKPFALGEVKCLSKQLLQGLQHLHQHSIIHRDVKTENVLITDSGTVKLTDFNTARQLATPAGSMTPNTTTLWYAPPEMLLTSKNYTTAVDVFSAGCVLAEMLTLEPLIQGDDPAGQLNLMLRVLGTPHDEERARLDDYCPGLEAWLAARPLSASGSIRAKVKDRGPETAAMLLALLRWTPVARYTASEALGEEGERDIKVARAWWNAEPRAVRRRELSFIHLSSNASDSSEAEEVFKSKDFPKTAEGASSPPAKRSRIH